MTSTPARWVVAALAVSTIALSTIACSAAPETFVLDTVGHVDGSSALVAVLAGDDHLTAYVCDGDRGIGERFTGTAHGDHAELRSAEGAILSVDMRPGIAEGTFTPAGGTPQHFTTTPATNDEAGFFTADGAAFSAGWIELNDGTQTGVLSQDGGGKDGKHKKRAPRLHHHRKPAGQPETIKDEGGRPQVTRVPAPNGNPGIVPPGRPDEIKGEGRPLPANGNPGLADSPDAVGLLGSGRPEIVKVPVPAPNPGIDRPVPGRDDSIAPLGAGGPVREIADPDDGEGQLAPLGGRPRPRPSAMGTIDEPTAAVDGVGQVAPHRVGVDDLVIHKPGPRR